MSRPAVPDEATLARLVERFYTAVRQDAELGPIFEARVHDWPAHLRQLTAFWAALALPPGAASERFQGNPMAAHRALPELRLEHFERWLQLWEQATSELLPPQAAAHLQGLAARIGQHLSRGIGLTPDAHGRALPLPVRRLE